MPLFLLYLPVLWVKLIAGLNAGPIATKSSTIASETAQKETSAANGNVKVTVEVVMVVASRAALLALMNLGSVTTAAEFRVLARSFARII